MLQLLIFFVGFAAALACITTPVTERKQLVLVSEEEMQKLGAETYEQILKEEKISTNRDLAAAVNQVGRAIAKASQRDYPWQFTVFDSDVLNAFCLPGGKVGVYTGLLQVADTNARLAAVIGHEVAHATAHHGAERLSQALLAQGVLGAVDKVFKDQRYHGLIMAALGLGAQFGVIMPYSRKHEEEADEIGMIYMAEAGYNPEAAIEVWQTMAALEKSRPPEFLSTHPHPETRIKNLKKSLGRAMILYERGPMQPTKRLPDLKEVAH